MEGATHFYHMQHFPKQEDGELFSVTVLIYDDSDTNYVDLGYYDFERSEWVVLGDLSFKMICWCYPPDPTQFLRKSNFKPETHRGYC